ncbi:hypothetical protein N656DRAFT_105068 [Canariomyces notabilis]|uniref:Uncharacterized protein n=1 Tax=Canariomyces notabilis TaxID=2074819 RepID=A0AAN6TD44_9PEZI|nr:hypothetical protein N656DRAFT_105068 [Canariomyces arenarius]
MQWNACTHRSITEPLAGLREYQEYRWGFGTAIPLCPHRNSERAGREKRSEIRSGHSNPLCFLPGRFGAFGPCSRANFPAREKRTVHVKRAFGFSHKKTTAAGAMFAGWGKGERKSGESGDMGPWKQGDPIEHPTTSEHGRECLPGVPPNLHSTRPEVPSPEQAEERTAEPMCQHCQGTGDLLRNPSKPIRRRRLALSERPPVLPGAILGTWAILASCREHRWTKGMTPIVPIAALIINPQNDKNESDCHPTVGHSPSSRHTMARMASSTSPSIRIMTSWFLLAG